MIARSKELILRELEEGTGASIAVDVNDTGLRSALRIWFSDLDEQRGPIAELRPHGLKGHRVDLALGNFSATNLTKTVRETAIPRSPLLLTEQSLMSTQNSA